jgi:class 3 adenylate cyclase/tetratricopeptide (TPR) repeat protein
MGLGRYAETFERFDIDDEVLPELSDADLVALGVSLGHRRRILLAVHGPEGRAPATRRGRAALPEADGERRTVSVLFADVAGFTALSENLDPEQVHTLMEGCFALIGRRIAGYEGTITQYAGDATMALFGAPLAQEDHAARCAHAALDIQEELAGYSEEVGRRLGVAFRMRIGLNTGVAVVGMVGHDRRTEYTALGDAVNLAARLEQAARPGEVLAADTTRRAAGAGFRWTRIGQRTLRGRSAPVLVHRLDGRTTRDRPAPPVPVTPLVGRDPELTALETAWEQTAAARGRVVSIVGEAGLGKSRLVAEFAGRRRREGVKVVEGTCFTYGDATSFLPFLRIVRALCGAPEEAPEPELKSAIAARVGALGLPAEEVVPYLHNLLSLRVDDEVFPHLTPELVRRRTVQALRSLLLAEAKREPLMVVVEDVHWIDRATEELVGVLVDGLAASRLLLALAYRPEYLNQWRDRSHHDEVHLHPLPEPSGAEMVRAILSRPHVERLTLRPLDTEQSLAVARRILGDAPIDPELERLIVGRTDGNPLFVEELARAMQEAGDVEEADGVLRLTRPAAELSVPPTLHAVLLARIDRLPDDLRRTLRLAATIGRVFSPDVLVEAAGGSEALAHLHRLSGLDFVHQVGTPPAGDYSFKHVLTQDAVYSTLLTAGRAAHHAAVAAAYERVQPDRAEENAEVLARHFDEAGDPGKAVEYLVLANRKAVRSNAVEEAYGHLTRATELLAELAPTPDRVRMLIRLLCDNVIVFQLLFRYEECYTRLLEVLPASAEVSPELEGMVLNRLGHMEWAFCALDAARARGRRSSVIWAGEDNPREQAYCEMMVGWVHLVAGDFTSVPNAERAALAALARGFDLRWHVWTLSFASLGGSWTGRWSVAIDRGERALALAEEYADASLVCFAAWVLGCAHACRGDVARALELGARAVATAPTPSDASWAGAMDAWFRIRSGDLDRAIATLEETVVANRSVGFVWSEVMASCLAEGYLRAGRLDEARATLDEIAAYCDRHGMRFISARADGLRGEVERAAGRVPEARAAFARAVEEHRALGSEHELAVTLAGLARLETDEGDADLGAALLEEAGAVHTRLGTPGTVEELPLA